MSIANGLSTLDIALPKILLIKLMLLRSLGVEIITFTGSFIFASSAAIEIASFKSPLLSTKPISFPRAPVYILPCAIDKCGIRIRQAVQRCHSDLRDKRTQHFTH